MEPQTIVIGFIVAVGTVGVIAGLMARNRLHYETLLLARKEYDFVNLVPEARQHDILPEVWLTENGIPSDSHIGERISAVWDGWRIGRSPDLAELHALSSGRERRYLAPRLAGGITALLVVIGITGTLSSIHPILQRFQIEPDATGAVDTAERAHDAREMIQHLGNAFMPSLWALIATLLAASARGYYGQASGELGWKLDHFTLRHLLPMFPARGLREELVELQQKLSEITERLGVREGEFAGLAEQFVAASADLKSAATPLRSATSGLQAAVGQMKFSSQEIVGGLEHHLGRGSLLARGIEAFAVSANANQAMMAQLKASAEVLAAASHAVTAKADFAVQQLSQASDHAATILAQSSAKAAAQLATSATESHRLGVASLEGATREAIGRLERAAADSTRLFGEGSDQLGNQIDLAARAAAARLAASIEGSVADAAGVVRQEVAPITTVAGEIRQANDLLQTGVRESLHTAAADFSYTTTQTKHSFKDGVNRTTELLTTTERNARVLTARSEELLKKFESLPLNKSWWARLLEVLKT